MKKMFLLFLVFSLVSFGGYKENLEKRMKIVEKGINKDTESTAEAVDAQVKTYEAWDKEMNIVYKKLINKIEEIEKKYGEEYKGFKASLIKTQKSWIEFRDNEGDFSQRPFGRGSMGRVVRAGTRSEMTKDRTLELAEYYDEVSEF